VVGPGGGFDVTFVVNELGNLTQGPAGVYTYPTPGDGVARGQRALLHEDSTVTLTLDSRAERTVTSGGLTERRWYTIAGTVAAVQQHTPTGVVSWNIVLGDIRGSAAVTIARGTSTIISQWWTPYGERRGTRNDPIGTRGYLNQPEDSASGLSYLNHRYLDPRLGIFLSVDPLITTTNEPYLYASGNPTTLADPTGLMALPGGEWLCEGGGVHGCRNSTRQNQNYNQKNNQWNDLHQRQRTTGNVGSGCHLGTTNHGHCTPTSGLRPISTLTDLLFDPDACRNASWNCAIEILGIIPYGKIAKLGKFATLAKTTDRLNDTADTAHDIHKATEAASPGLSGVNRVGSALKTDAQHAFPDVVDNFATEGSKFSIPTKGPGGVVVRNSELFQVEGSLNGKSGVFEWIVDQGDMTHRRFIPGGKVTGYPNQVPTP
jgi:RHS repeat-associated protein